MKQQVEKFRKSILFNWSFSLVELDERIYRQLSIYLWTFRKRQEFNEQLKKRMVMSEINEYYITTQYENYFVEHTLFYSIIAALNKLHIEYKRDVSTHFRKNVCGYDKITCVYLYADFNLLFYVIRYYDEKG